MTSKLLPVHLFYCNPFAWCGSSANYSTVHGSCYMSLSVKSVSFLIYCANRWLVCRCIVRCLERRRILLPALSWMSSSTASWEWLSIPLPWIKSLQFSTTWSARSLFLSLCLPSIWIGKHSCNTVLAAQCHAFLTGEMLSYASCSRTNMEWQMVVEIVHMLVHWTLTGSKAAAIVNGLL